MDATRVILTGRPCDYIHANWIKFADGKKFICTQAPMESSVRDFWQMVLQENCHLIIMLCSFIEEDKQKCVPYFPTLAGTSIMVEDVTITLKERNNNGLITTSMFVVKTKDQELHVRHIQYTEWPDHSAPLKTAGALEIHREIFNNPRQYPLIIHCSAGVGRTCTIVGAELMLERISARQFHTATDIVRIMRRARAGAVQKAVQFLFMHYIVLEVFCQVLHLHAQLNYSGVYSDEAISTFS
ncbi:unnamed protein product [Haemonchus placei]|uniref:Protein-tyrosine phosphatase n=1 Tax=Haemonchus placei TaxID=6290 RepID=A0A0N4W8I6_HAEPC|nr:unnamed protein product [Haemonchus placei]